MSLSGQGFGSDPSWRCQEEPGHFAALLAREETPTELLPEPDPPGAALGETSRLCFPCWGHSPAHLGMEIFISGCLTAPAPCLASCRARAGLWDQLGWVQSWHSSTGMTWIGDKHRGTAWEQCWDSAPALLAV